MPKRHFLTLADVSSQELTQLVRRSVEFAAGQVATSKPLAEKIIGIYFRKPSTRTRTAFTVAALKLGAQVIAYGSNDLQLVTGETLEDTARVLSGYLDGFVLRTNESVTEMEVLASSKMAVVNAMSKQEHPSQVVGDLGVLTEHYGRLAGLHILYVGEGNNTAAALAWAVAKVPDMKLTLLTPVGYSLPSAVVAEANTCALTQGSCIEQCNDPNALPQLYDVVYTTRWQTMGVPHSDPDWRETFLPYGVTSAFFTRVTRANAVFLHDLPAVRDDEVTDEVLNLPNSLVWRQAEYKLYAAMAILEHCLGAA